MGRDALPRREQQDRRAYQEKVAIVVSRRAWTLRLASAHRDGAIREDLDG
jgi:hypothetical protein